MLVDNLKSNGYYEMPNFLTDLTLKSRVELFWLHFVSQCVMVIVAFQHVGITVNNVVGVIIFLSPFQGTRKQIFHHLLHATDQDKN